MKIKGSLKRKILYRELYEVLKRHDPDCKMEVPFSHFIKTKRKFRADFLCPNLSLIVEVNGGQWINGRHNRGGKNYENDLNKLNLAQVHGYHVMQFTYEMLERGEHFKILLSYCKSTL